MEKLKGVLLKGMRKLSEQHTRETLGDRQTYIGASEIGGCPRKTILNKVYSTEHDLATLFRFKRGHMAEDLIAEALVAAGFTNFERQVEVQHTGENVPLRAHLDFVFTSKTSKTKAVLEIKSTDGVPERPYGSWETQIHIQTGLLAKKHPDYSVKGAILAVDLNIGEIALFNHYEPSGLLEGLVDRAETIWTDYQNVQNNQTVDLETEVSPLCGYCEHIETCPRFQGEEVLELAGPVEELVELQEQVKALQGQIKKKKQKLQAIVEKRGPIVTGKHFLQQATRNNHRLNMTRLDEFFGDNGFSLDEFKENNPYSFLEIRKIKAKAA